jgi:uncharacterized protein (DUF927 family)
MTAAVKATRADSVYPGAAQIIEEPQFGSRFEAGAEYCRGGSRLSAAHLKLIRDSAISPGVAADRGYRTVTMKAELDRLGFAPSQRITPTLLIPRYDMTGKLAGYQHRPDNPRFKNKKPIKYETPSGSQMGIDVHPSLSRRPGERVALLKDPSFPLVITEGIRKADSAVSIDLCCIGLLGVWNWRGSNDAGGLTALPDWEDVALNDRRVYIAFDSDVMINNHVYLALRRFGEFLSGRHAVVRFIYIPAGSHGEKVGLDDFIAARLQMGHNHEQIRSELLSFAVGKLRKPIDFEQSNTENPDNVNNSVQHPFRLTETAVEYAEKGEDGSDWHFVCSRLEITAATRNELGQNWGRLLQFKDDDGHHHEYALPMELLAGDGAAYRERLLSMGLHIGAGPKARNRLHEYIQTTIPPTRAISVSRLGWHNCAFVMPDIVFGTAGTERIIYQPLRNEEHNFREAGTLAEWQEHVGKPCVGNTRLAFTVSCAFAAPLLYLTDSESGGFHFRGDSSVGKTTAGWAAGSVCGGGGIRGYLIPWRATVNGLENVAVAHCDLLLVLDEISQAESKAVAQAAYLLANGQGASRMRRDTSSRPIATWRTLFLSSGEISLATKVQEDGRRKATAGQEVRVLDIPAKVSDELGLFENLHEASSSRDFADNIRKAASEYYGTPLRKFLTCITASIEEAKEAIEAAKAEFVEKHFPKNASGQVGRAVDRFGLVAAAGELAIAYGILPWETGEATKAAAACFEAWLDNRAAGTEAAEIAAGIAQIRKFFEAHGESRFTLWGDETATNKNDAGSTPDIQRPTFNRAGFRRTIQGRIEFFVLPETFTTELCAGFDAKALARALIKRGLLIPGKDNKSAVSVTLPGIGKMRVYHFTSNILSDSEEQ